MCPENSLAQGAYISPLLGVYSTMRGNLYSKVRTDTTWSMQRLKSRHVCGRCRERPVALYLDSSFFTGSRQDASKSAVSATCSRCSNCGKIRSIDVLANELINRIINGRVCDGAQVSHLLDCPGKMVDRSPTPPEFPIDHHENMLWAFFSFTYRLLRLLQGWLWKHIIIWLSRAFTGIFHYASAGS